MWLALGTMANSCIERINNGPGLKCARCSIDQCRQQLIDGHEVVAALLRGGLLQQSLHSGGVRPFIFDSSVG